MASGNAPRIPSARPMTRAKMEMARDVYSALKRKLNEIPSWGLVDDKDLDLFFTVYATQKQAELFLHIHEKISYGNKKLI